MTMITDQGARQHLQRSKDALVIAVSAIAGGIVFQQRVPALAMTLLVIYMVALLIGHFFLAKTVMRTQRSWVTYGLLPILCPLVGAWISYIVLWSAIYGEDLDS